MKYHHTALTRIPIETAKKEILRGKSELEEITGREITVFCYPKGRYSNKIIELVKKTGFKGARTTDIFRTTIHNVFKVGVTIQAHNFARTRYISELIRTKDTRLFNFLIKNVPNFFYSSWEELGMATLSYVNKFGGIWHLQGHSWEIDEETNGWEKLEKLFKIIRELARSPDVTLMDNSQLIHNFYSD